MAFHTLFWLEKGQLDKHTDVRKWWEDLRRWTVNSPGQSMANITLEQTHVPFCMCVCIQ